MYRRGFGCWIVRPRWIAIIAIGPAGWAAGVSALLIGRRGRDRHAGAISPEARGRGRRQHNEYHITRRLRPMPVHYPALLRLARTTLAHYLTTGERPPHTPDNEWFREPSAVLSRCVRQARKAASPYSEGWHAGDLRGCVGHIYADKPLSEAVQEATIQAASADPRFYPVTADELDNLTMRFRALSPFRPVDHWTIAIGQDGLTSWAAAGAGCSCPKCRCHGWLGHTFLTALCEKAGLPPK